MGRAVRLRRWLLGGSVLLLALIVGFVGYARYRIRQAKLDLPRLLGADIKSETDGFTWSQSVKGRTLFTIHAAKAIQHSNGKTMLRNVAVTVYGEPGSNRVDRIRGSEFEYDQAAGVVRAMGESEIDLASVAGDGEGKRVRVIANGLVFDQKKGTATADGLIRFETGAVQGMATGAAFDAHTGLLVLQHDVHVLNLAGRERQEVDADRAELDRTTRVAHLHGATVMQGAERLRAGLLQVRLRPSGGSSGGSMEAVDGSGGVEVRTGDGATATAPAMQASLTGENRLHEATLLGGVVLHAAAEDGRAGRAVLHFDGAGHATGVQLASHVELTQTAPAGHRALTADAVDAALGADAAGHAVLRDTTATGHAVLRLDTSAGAGKAAETTVMNADVLHAFGESRGGKWQVQRVAGDGSTRLEQRMGGEVRSSAGGHLEATFGSGTGPVEVTSFVQQGQVHVVDDRAAVGKRAAAHSVADAQRAEYRESEGTVVLTGAPVVRTDSLQVEATRITVVRETGDADAMGAVRGSVFQAEKGAADFSSSRSSPPPNPPNPSSSATSANGASTTASSPNPSSPRAPPPSSIRSTTPRASSPTAIAPSPTPTPTSTSPSPPPTPSTTAPTPPPPPSAATSTNSPNSNASTPDSKSSSPSKAKPTTSPSTPAPKTAPPSSSPASTSSSAATSPPASPSHACSTASTSIGSTPTATTPPTSSPSSPTSAAPWPPSAPAFASPSPSAPPPTCMPVLTSPPSPRRSTRSAS